MCVCVMQIVAGIRFITIIHPTNAQRSTCIKGNNSLKPLVLMQMTKPLDVMNREGVENIVEERRSLRGSCPGPML
jgi:hypothetical protein